MVHIIGGGVRVPGAVGACGQWLEEGVNANVISITGPGPLYRRFQESVNAEMKSKPGMSEFMADVVPAADRAAPVVTVVDGHPHSLAWIGSALNTASLPLGVSGFGQSGSRPELYHEYGIDVESIMAACFGALEI